MMFTWIYVKWIVFLILVSCWQSCSVAVEDRVKNITSVFPSVPKLIHQPRSFVDKHRDPGYTSGSLHLDTLSWIVKIDTDSSLWWIWQSNTEEYANDLAERLGLVNKGLVGHFSDIYVFEHAHHKDLYESHPDYHSAYRKQKIHIDEELSKADTNKPIFLEFSLWNGADPIAATPLHHTINSWDAIVKSVQEYLNKESRVEWFTRQSVRPRLKRSLTFDDPMLSEQWHIVNYNERGMDVNVTSVWERGVTGKDVVVVVVDDGLEWTVPDILGNYNSQGSWDLNSNDNNPLPDTSNPHNHHGTRCAGEIAAVANNKYCGVGVAYDAGIAGIRVLDGPMTDNLEATAFTKNFDINDIYSCSWGPDDDGKTVDGPHHLANLALRHGVAFGRQGYGSVYVVASGNGGSSGDNCNYDGYANSIFTITIGAVDETEHMPYYAEECASMLAVTFSSGNSLMRSITTADWLHHGGTGCTTEHTGTSAAAPLAAGMIALMLSARPCLTWRDIQHILVITAVKVDIDVAQWQKNAAGLHHSHKHGFGMMDAWRLVNAAKTWEPVPWMTVYTSVLHEVNDHISARTTLKYTMDVTQEMLMGYNLNTLEYVQVTLTIEHVRRGDLQVLLDCPSKTHSVLGAYRPQDDSSDGFHAWTFSTVRCWGEKPDGLYTITVNDRGQSGMNRGVFISWQLKLFGSAITFGEMQERMKKVEASYSGQYLNDSYQAPCPPPPDNVKVVAPLSEKVLKILALTGAFATFMAVYESLEYMFCYDKEKKEHSRLIALYKQAQGLVNNRTPDSVGEPSGERQSLLSHSTSHEENGEMIPLQPLNTNNVSQYGDVPSTSLFQGVVLDNCEIELANQASSYNAILDLPTSKSSNHPNGKAKNSRHSNHERQINYQDSDLDFDDFVSSDH